MIKIETEFVADRTCNLLEITVDEPQRRTFEADPVHRAKPNRFQRNRIDFKNANPKTAISVETQKSVSFIWISVSFVRKSVSLKINETDPQINETENTFISKRRKNHMYR